MLKRFAFLTLSLILLLCATVTDAQVTPEVWVTTQDYAVLRAGPGTTWDRLTVLPFGATYRATGRNTFGTWIQVAYEGALDPGARTDVTIDGITYGWVSYRLLIWTGNILELPIDGIETARTARAVGPTIILMPDTPIYVGVVDPSTRMQNPYTTPITVEVTGRLGSAGSGYYWIQFKMNNQFYWTGTWAVPMYGTPNVPDAAYLYPYSRLYSQLRRESSRLYNVLSDIGGRWRSLLYGTGATCNDIPEDAAIVGLTDADLQLEPIYAPPTNALRAAQIEVNAALALFREVCAAPTQGVTPDTIQRALEHVDAAERYLNIVGELITPLQRRDPILGELEN